MKPSAALSLKSFGRQGNMPNECLGDDTWDDRRAPALAGRARRRRVFPDEWSECKPDRAQPSEEKAAFAAGDRLKPAPYGAYMSCWAKPGGGEYPARKIQCFLLAVFFCVLAPSGFGQAIYAQNQIPARGVEIEYTVTIKNPISHIYDVEMSIKGIREGVVSISMPAWSPGMY